MGTHTNMNPLSDGESEGCTSKYIVGRTRTVHVSCTFDVSIMRPPDPFGARCCQNPIQNILNKHSSCIFQLGGNCRRASKQNRPSTLQVTFHIVFESDSLVIAMHGLRGLSEPLSWLTAAVVDNNFSSYINVKRNIPHLMWTASSIDSCIRTPQSAFPASGSND